MPSILFLVNGATPARNDNHLRLPRAFAALGWQTVTADHADVRWDGGHVYAGREDLARISHQLPAVAADALALRGRAPSGRFDILSSMPASSSGPRDRAGRRLDALATKVGEISGLARFDLIWLLGFGRRRSYFDRMQLLRRLDQRRFVNPVDAYTYLHGKLPPVDSLARHMPETHAAASADHLLECLDNLTDWVLKPSGASFGRDVALIRDDRNGRAAIRKLVERDGFAVLQRYVPAIEQGEVRCLIAGGEIVGCYRRLPAAADIRTNLARGGKPECHELTKSELRLAKEIARRLADTGIGFAAVDLAEPYLIEINIANPGGLQTLESLTGFDPAPRTVEAIANWKKRSHYPDVSG